MKAGILAAALSFVTTSGTFASYYPKVNNRTPPRSRFEQSFTSVALALALSLSGFFSQASRPKGPPAITATSARLSALPHSSENTMSKTIDATDTHPRNPSLASQ
jgi:hypothetical protein